MLKLFHLKMNQNREATMAEQEFDKILDHNYDGIEEYDNPLPKWWVNLFILTVIFGIGYFWWYEMSGNGSTQLSRYADSWDEFKTEQAALLASGAIEDNSFKEGEVFTFTNDAAVLAEGKEIFDKNCISCHREDAGGNIGPNLTDEYWLHGGSMNDIVKVVVDGVPENGMISWKPLLKKKQIVAVSNYIKSLKGTNPENPKEPQGDLWEEDSAEAANTDVSVN